MPEPKPAPVPAPETMPAVETESAPAAAPVELSDFDGLVTYLTAKGAPVALTLLRQLRVVAFQPGHIEFEVHDRLPKDFQRRLREELSRATDRVWALEAKDSGGKPSIADQEAAEEDVIKAHPLVQAALDAFPDGTLSIGRPPAQPTDMAAEAGAAGDAFPDAPRDDAEPDLVYDDDIHFGDWEPDD